MYGREIDQRRRFSALWYISLKQFRDTELELSGVPLYIEIGIQYCKGSSLLIDGKPTGETNSLRILNDRITGEGTYIYI
jgi:hypothetical protein